jgi:hypothetical protein
MTSRSVSEHDRKSLRWTASPSFAQRRNFHSFDPLAVRSFNVEDCDVPLLPDYVTCLL